MDKHQETPPARKMLSEHPVQKNTTICTPPATHCHYMVTTLADFCYNSHKEIKRKNGFICPFHASEGQFLTRKKLYFNSHSWETRVLRHTDFAKCHPLRGTLSANDRCAQTPPTCAGRLSLPAASNQLPASCHMLPGLRGVSDPGKTEDPAMPGQHHPGLSAAT